jgi:hypothetical protein
MAEGEDVTREDVLPIIASPKYQLINVYRDGLTYLSPVTKEGSSSCPPTVAIKRLRFSEANFTMKLVHTLNQ